MLDKVKRALRITNSLSDDDIQRTIDACLEDIERVGVVGATLIQDDTTICELCVLYVKAQYNYLNEGERWLKNYEARRDAISMYDKYNQEGGTTV